MDTWNPYPPDTMACAMFELNMAVLRFATTVLRDLGADRLHNWFAARV